MDDDQPPETPAGEPASLKTLIHCLPDMVWLKDPDGVFLTCNARAEQLLGTPEAAVCGKTDDDFFPPTEASVYRERDREAIATGASVIHRQWVTLRDGGRRAFMETVRTPMRDSAGRLVGVLGIARDITVSHQEQEALRERLAVREQLESIAATLPGAIFSLRLRPGGGISVPYASPALADVWGLRPEELANDASAIWTTTHPDDTARIRQAFEESARTLSPWQDEFRVRHPVKGEVWIEGRSIPVREADGSILWHGFLADITARKRVEEALRENQDRAARLFHEAPAPMSITDVETGRFLDVNDKMVETSGFNRSELIGKTSVEIGLFLPEDRARLFDVLRTEGSVSERELTFRRKNGQ